MRNLIVSLLFILAVSHNVFTQWGASCDTVRWIRIEVDSSISYLKRYPEMLSDLKRLTKKGKGVCFLEGGDISDKAKWYPHLLINMTTDSLSSWQPQVYPYDGEDSSFLIFYNGEYPFCNEIGDPVEIFRPDYGVIEYVYPHPSYTEIVPTEINEIRVREKLVWNENLKRSVYEPEAIRFFPTYGFTGSELWFDLSKVKQFIAEENVNWINFFIDKRYSGFQYMQTNCTVE